MPTPRTCSRRAALALAVLVTSVSTGAPVVANAVEPGAACARTASSALRSCLRRVSAARRSCILSGRGCGQEDPRVLAALAALETRVRTRCSSAEALGPAGYGDVLSPDGLAVRLETACTDEIAALEARSFGGPQHRALGGASASQRGCLGEAFRRSSFLVQRSFGLLGDCVRRERMGRSCDLTRVAEQLGAQEQRALERIGQSCDNLVDLVGIDVGEIVARAAAQARCLVPTALGDAAPLDLDCGPRASVPVPARGVATRVVLDEAEWGTRCGDGSSYAFWIQLAPAGSPVENVIVHMQGGGVCILESDCQSVSSGLLRALDNSMATGGYLSSTSSANPFRDWTKVYLPYCTQDIHIGGGTTSSFPSITVHRFGAVNVRASLRYLRDVLWAELDTTPEGYRPDRLRVLFGGTSAGGFGASYNYHYLLDDLRWSRSTAVPDSSLGLDNGEIVGIRSLGSILLSESAPLGWGSRPFLPPYCKVASCAVVPVLHTAHTARLGSVPEQQILSLSNQVDDTQVGTTFFASRRAWLDALREAYCATQGLPGLRYFLPAVASHIHGIVQGSSLFSLTSDGQTASDWLATAVADPGALVDRVEEGDLAALLGAMPFSCPVGSSG